MKLLMNNIKAFLAHMLSLFISLILSLGYGIVHESEILLVMFYVVNFLLICSLYILSGYLIAKWKVSYWNYSSVALVGIAFWIICMLISPHNFNFKDGQAAVWLLYELYVSAIASPILLFIGKLHNSWANSCTLCQVFILLGLSIVPTILQIIGAKLKFRIY